MASTGLMTTQTSFTKQTHVIHKEYMQWRDDIPEQWRTFFNEYTAPKKGRFVQFMPIIGLGRFQQKPEGAAAVYDAPHEGRMFFTSFSTYALGVSITKEGRIEDPLDLMAKAPKFLAQSARDTKDKIAVGMYVFAFGGGKLLPDGQPLISAAHPMDPQVSPTGFYSGSGIYQSNSLGNMQLTPETLMYADNLSQSWVNDRGLKAKKTLTRLVIPNNSVLEQIAQEIVGTPTHPNEINRKDNPQHNRWKVQVNRDLVSQSQFFLQAENGEPGEDCHGLTVWIRWNDGDSKGGNGFHSFEDQQTQNRVIISSFRLAIGAWDWPGIVGSLGGGPVSG
jgi:hypothetical protein